MKWILAAGLLLASATLAAQDKLRLEGEIVAREKAALLPPAIDGMWQLNITQLSRTARR